MAAVSVCMVGRECCSLFETNVDVFRQHRFMNLHTTTRGEALQLNISTSQRQRKSYYASCLAINSNSTTPLVQPAESKRPAAAAANSLPRVWSINDFVATLKNKNYKQDEVYNEMAIKLEREIRIMIEDEIAGSPLKLLDLIDNIERLGLGYRFEKDISAAIATLEGVGDDHRSLHTTALRFRLLRQHGYEVSQDVFKSFKDDNSGTFMSNLLADVKGLLSLYEASFMGFEGENLLDEAKLFARKGLENIKQNTESKLLAKVISHTLVLPGYRRTIRFAARPYIDAYSRKEDAKASILQLAKVDFNIVQSALQQDLVQVLRWWKNIGLAGKLSFSTNDSLLECFFWTIGISFEPHLSSCRISLTKLAAFLTAIDDLYDNYPSMDELQLFTDSVKRWDVNDLKHLPDSLRLFFLALHTTVNEMAYDALKEHGENTLPLLKKVWGELCEALLQETKWNHKKLTPRLEDYIENAWRSSSGVVILAHAFLLRSQNVTTEALVLLEKEHHLLKWSSMILRLNNDSASLTRELASGETANTITCYMRNNGVSEEVARQYLNNLIDEAWKKLNEARLSSESQFSWPFIETAINLARLSHSAYNSGDDHRIPDKKAKKQIFSLLIEPFAITV